MNSTFLSVAVAAALSIAAIAQAAPAADNDTVNIQAPAVKRYAMQPVEFDDYAHSYNMSNGDTMKFTHGGGTRYYTEVSGNRRVEIIPVSATEFVTRDGARISFSTDGNELTVNNYERVATTHNLPSNTIMVARR